MNQHLTYFQWTRTNIIALIEKLTLEQLNQIPKGFNNNIIWNAGHIHFVQQFLVYKLAGLSMDLSEGFMKRYAPGCRPDIPVEHSEVEYIKKALNRYSTQTEQDLEVDMFKNFEPFKGSYFLVAFDLRNWDQSLAYNNIHEAMHYGYMRALAKAVQAEPQV